MWKHEPVERKDSYIKNLETRRSFYNIEGFKNEFFYRVS